MNFSTVKIIATNYQRHNGVAIFHAASSNLTAEEKYELSKGFDIYAQ